MRPPRKGLRGLHLWILAGIPIASFLGSWTPPELSAPVPSLQQDGPRVVVGEFPPDFELPRLTFGENEDGKPVGIIDEENKFRLSDFRGKRPVCMIMSSYT